MLLVQDPGADPIVISGGVADREAKTPMDTEDAFRIGSLTKTYVAVVVMQLVEEGSVGLDDAIEQHLPAVPRLRPPSSSSPSRRCAAEHHGLGQALRESDSGGQAPGVHGIRPADAYA